MTGRAVLDVVEGQDAFRHAKEWDDLLLRTERPSFFRSSVWCRAWWDVLVGRPPLAVGLVRDDDGELIGLVALTKVRDPLHRRLPIPLPLVTIAGTGIGAADHAGILVAPGGEPVVAQALGRWIESWAGRRSLLAANLDPADVAVGLLTPRAALLAVERCPVATWPPGTTWPDVEASWTVNRRRSLRKKTRRFQDRGGSFEWLEPAPPDVLDLVFELHAQRIAERSVTSTFGASPENRAFHRALVSSARPGLATWVQVARLGDRPIGVLYGFRCRGVYSVYQSGWAPDGAELSIGLIQYAQAMRHAVESGGEMFDMCRGADAYKVRFATEVRVEPTLAVLRGPTGLLLRGRAAVRRRRRSAGEERSDDATD